MIARNFLVLCLSGLWFLAGNWYYNCKLMNCVNCAAASAAAAPVISPAFKAETGPILFNYTKGNAITNQEFKPYKEAVLGKMTADNKLEITGHYFKGEPNTSKFANMGMARANAAKLLFLDKVPDNRIVLVDKLVGDREGIKDHPFVATDFKWIAGPIKKVEKPVETKVIEVDNKALIYFPFKSTEKISNPKIDAYLEKVAKRMKQTKETITITGHTDNIGEVSDNLTLGKQRADRIKSLLVKKGIAANRIVTSSKGESQPIGSNDTDEGRQKNRRTELVIK